MQKKQEVKKQGVEKQVDNLYLARHLLNEHCKDVPEDKIKELSAELSRVCAKLSYEVNGTVLGEPAPLPKNRVYCKYNGLWYWLTEKDQLVCGTISEEQIAYPDWLCDEVDPWDVNELSKDELEALKAFEKYAKFQLRLLANNK
jgi:hypothetical protein